MEAARERVAQWIDVIDVVWDAGVCGYLGAPPVDIGNRLTIRP